MKKQSNYTGLKIKALDIIRKSGPITKREISKILNTNIGTITRIVNTLDKKHNLINVSGKDTSESGRRPDLYVLNRKIGYIVGIDIGSENIRVVINDMLGEVAIGTKYKVNSDNAIEIMDEIARTIDDLVSKLRISMSEILGIGVGVSGFIETGNGVSIFCPNRMGFNDFPLDKYLVEKFKKPVIVEDSVRCMAKVEKEFGAAKNVRNFIFVMLGIGIGTGIYIRDELYEGSIGITGEMGHITIIEDGPLCNCGNRGCLEVLASGNAIVKRAKDGIEKGVITSLSSYAKKGSEFGVDAIAKAAQDGDKFAYELISRTGEYVGIGISTVLNLFGPRLIIIGGGVAESGDILLNEIKRIVKMRALEMLTKKVKIINTTIGDNGGARGAAMLFVDSIFEKKNKDILLEKIEA